MQACSMLPSAVGQCVAALVAVHGLQRMPEAHNTQCGARCFISIRNARPKGVVCCLRNPCPAAPLQASKLL